MKKNIIFLILFLLTGCVFKTVTPTKIPCPNVLFAAEHNKYITGNTQPISVDKINYKANINNYSFNDDCSIMDDAVQIDLSILFIVTPYQAEVSNVTLPFYVTVLNERKTLVDIQYYRVDGNLERDTETKKYIETELNTTITVKILSQDHIRNSGNTIVVGFMLDKEKLDILN